MESPIVGNWKSVVTLPLLNEIHPAAEMWRYQKIQTKLCV